MIFFTLPFFDFYKHFTLCFLHKLHVTSSVVSLSRVCAARAQWTLHASAAGNNGDAGRVNNLHPLKNIIPKRMRTKRNSFTHGLYSLRLRVSNKCHQPRTHGRALTNTTAVRIAKINRGNIHNSLLSVVCLRRV